MKPLVGYSDVTFLHLAFHAELGWTTFHGPNLMDVAGDDRCALGALALSRDKRSAKPQETLDSSAPTLLSPARLAGIISSLDRGRLLQMADNARALAKPLAAVAVAHACAELAGGDAT